MSIKITFNGATLLKPGAYSKIVVENLTGFPLQPTGVVGIIGEAIGGEPGVLDILSQAGIQSAKTRYKSGPISDALDLLVNGSKDPRIVNGASTIVVYKTNAGTRSSANLVNEAAANKILLSSKNFGADENNDSCSVSTGAILDSEAEIDGSVNGPFNLAGGETLIVKVNNVTYTYTNTLIGAAITSAALMADINNGANWAPSKPLIASLATGGLKLILTKDPTVGGKLDYGSLEIVPASTIDTIIGVSGSARGKKGSRFLQFKKDNLVETSLELGGQDVLSIKYIGAGTGALLSIQDSAGVISLTTVIAGAAADDLNFVLKDAAGKEPYTLAQLVGQINAFGGGSKYQASVLSPNPAQSAGDLDYYLNLDIFGVAAKLRRDDAVLVDFVNASSSISNAARVVNAVGALAITSIPVVYSGGSDGVSANSDFANGFLAFQSQRINTVVPLISKDIGPLSIDSINALAANHASWGWSTTGKSERSAFVSKLGSKAAYKAACQTLNSGYVSATGQCPTVLDKNSNLVEQDPWALACIAAGMRAGAEVGEPLTKKFININSLRVKDGSWDPRIDYNEMIDAGCLIAEPVDTGGFRWVVGNTTYGIDPSFVWNRESVVQAAGYVAFDLRFNLELQFTGTKAKTGAAEAIANFIKARMTQYLDANVIVGDDLNKGLGYKNLSVQVQGNQAIINVSVTPVQGIDFILPTIYLADIRQSA